jgi:hypothetical protein
MGFASANAYWVRPEQVKLVGPSGTYLPKGGFLMEGTKHLYRGLRVEVAVGVAELDGDLALMAGPPRAVEAHTLAHVVLIPLPEGKVSDAAKRVREALLGLLEEPLSAQLKRLPLDEFVRTLPPGGGRVVRRVGAKD